MAEASGRQGSKSAVAAGILALLLGGLGVHRFYLGYVGVGFAYLGALLAALLLFWLVIPLILPMITAVLALVEGILLLTGGFDTDARGDRLLR
ncbi:MAG: NINE protein [Nitriliruptoraceae bacterium]